MHFIRAEIASKNVQTLYFTIPDAPKKSSTLIYMRDHQMNGFSYIYVYTKKLLKHAFGLFNV